MPHEVARFAGQVYVWGLVIGVAVFGGGALRRAVLRRLLNRRTPPVQPVQPPRPAPCGVYRVPTWAARTPQSLRQHPDLAQIDQHLDTWHQQHATYYPTATERSTP